MRDRLRYTITLQEERDRNGCYVGLEAIASAPIEQANGEIVNKEIINVNAASYPDVLLRMASNIIAFEMGLKPVYKRAHKEM